MSTIYGFKRAVNRHARGLAAVPPTFTSITPSTIAQNTSASYAIVGTNLNNTQSLINLPAGVSSGLLVCSDSSHATVVLAAAASAPVASASANVSDPVNGNSGSETFAVTAGTPNGTAVTEFYLNAGTPTSAPSASQSVAFPGSLTPETIVGGMVFRKLASTVSSANDGEFVYSASGGASKVLNFDGFVSDGLSEQIIPAGTHTFHLGGYTEGATVTFKFAPTVYIWRPSTGAVVGFLRDDPTGLGSAIPTTEPPTPQALTFTLGTGLPIQNGDVLAIEVKMTGTGSDYCHFKYSGNTSDCQAAYIPPSAIYTAPTPLGIVRVGPSGLSSSTSSPTITPVTVSSDSDWRSKMVPSGAGNLWDTNQASKNGSATGSPLDASSFFNNDLAVVDTVTTFTDRDSVTRNTLKITIEPGPGGVSGGGVSSSNDSRAASSSTPQAEYPLPAGMGFYSWMQRQLYRFSPGIRFDAPNNTTSNASGFNSTQASAYKLGPHPSNSTGRADMEITGCLGAGAGYMTASFSSPTDIDSYIVGTLSTMMPGWNTGGDVWEIVRVQRITGPTTGRQAIYIGKVGDTYLTKVKDVTANLDTGKQGAWSADNEISLMGKNFNRQLASTDTPPVMNVSDVQFADITEATFTWPAQIQVADRI